MPSETSIILRNFRLWSFARPADGPVHFAVPEEGILHTVNAKLLRRKGTRELMAIDEMQLSCNAGACVATEQFAGG
jgi:hypothetical protein